MENLFAENLKELEKGTLSYCDGFWDWSLKTDRLED
jgi:hypothetical protein